VHHRVKNNLQVINSLLNLQMRESPSELVRSSFQDAQTRIRALSLVHNQLYESQDLARIDLKDLLENLCAALAVIHGIDQKPIETEIAVPRRTIGMDNAIPLALLATEAITNAFKYAFPDNRAGRLGVSMDVQPGEVSLL